MYACRHHKWFNLVGWLQPSMLSTKKTVTTDNLISNNIRSMCMSHNDYIINKHITANIWNDPIWYGLEQGITLIHDDPEPQTTLQMFSYDIDGDSRLLLQPRTVISGKCRNKISAAGIHTVKEYDYYQLFCCWSEREPTLCYPGRYFLISSVASVVEMGKSTLC